MRRFVIPERLKPLVGRLRPSPASCQSSPPSNHTVANAGHPSNHPCVRPIERTTFFQQEANDATVIIITHIIITSHRSRSQHITIITDLSDELET